MSDTITRQAERAVTAARYYGIGPAVLTRVGYYDTTVESWFIHPDDYCGKVSDGAMTVSCERHKDHTTPCLFIEQVPA